MKQAVGDLHLTVGKYRLRYRIADASGRTAAALSGESLGQNRSAPPRKHGSALHVACGFVVVDRPAEKHRLRM